VSLTPGPQPAVVVIRVSKYSFSSQEKPRDLSPRGFSDSRKRSTWLLAPYTPQGISQSWV
jgi:hypothetical protein